MSSDSMDTKNWVLLRNIELGLRICTRLILLLALAFIRGAVSLVEQPSSTLMLLFPYVCWFAKLVALFSNWLVTRLLDPQFWTFMN
jgi:hypothetical protein